jgi:hypothetical protein
MIDPEKSFLMHRKFFGISYALKKPAYTKMPVLSSLGHNS